MSTHDVAGQAYEIAIVGGSGLYELAGLQDLREFRLETPFGTPSDAFLGGRIGDREVVFLSRHGRQHTLLPAEINYRANFFALKMLGVRRVLSISAVGSMREEIHPRNVVTVDQFIDRTHGRPSTFFGEGIVAHISFGDPVCPELRDLLTGCSGRQGADVHDGGTYVCIQGPAFSTRAESRLYRSWGVDVIGMTNFQEARLAREAEICYATLAMVTDYDCWHEEQEDVSVAALLDNLRANSELAGKIVHDAVVSTPRQRQACACHEALRHALITPPEAIPGEVGRRLAPLVGRYLGSA